MNARADARYWDTVGASWGGPPRQTLWRTHSDTINTAWLAGRLPTPAVHRLLKTDLFDEALTGGLYPFLSAQAHAVIGVDISGSTVRTARARHAPLLSAQADVRALPFADAVFDCVVSNSTLDHFTSLADIGAGLAEIYRVLRPGGDLLLTLDNLANPLVAVRNLLPFRPLNVLGIVPYQVGATCGPRRLRRIVTHARFEVREVGAILHCPRVFAVAAARLLERYGSARVQQRFLRFLRWFEHLAHWPTCFRTGYFITIVARKP